jgi:hypothetical protein
MKHLLSYEEFVPLIEVPKFSLVTEKKKKSSSEKKERLPKGHIQHFLEEFATL